MAEQHAQAFGRGGRRGQSNSTRQSNRQQQERTTWRINNMIRHYHKQVKDFRMGNWDRSEQILEALMEDLRSRKAELDSRNAVMTFKPVMADLVPNTGDSSHKSEEKLQIGGYLKKFEQLQSQMDEFKQCLQSNRQQTVANNKAERTFIDAWIQLEQKRSPLIAKRSEAILIDDQQMLKECNDQILAIFREFYEISQLHEDFQLCLSLN